MHLNLHLSFTGRWPVPSPFCPLPHYQSPSSETQAVGYLCLGPGWEQFSPRGMDPSLGCPGMFMTRKGGASLLAHWLLSAISWV